MQMICSIVNEIKTWGDNNDWYYTLWTVELIINSPTIVNWLHNVAVNIT